MLQGPAFDEGESHLAFQAALLAWRRGEDTASKPTWQVQKAVVRETVGSDEGMQTMTSNPTVAVAVEVSFSDFSDQAGSLYFFLVCAVLHVFAHVCSPPSSTTV